MENKKKIGLVLSGGGARGAAHAGILKALEENGIRPNVIAGSSAGAIAGALYAADYSPQEILTFFKVNNKIFRWKHFARLRPGFFNAEKYADLFKPWLEGKTFSNLSKELHICVTDVLEGQPRFFSSGNLIKPILASAAVPGIFTPVEIERKWYIDGGTMNNFPVEPLLGKCDIILGSMASPTKVISKKDLSSSMRLINRASNLSFHAASLSKFQYCDIVFSPEELCHFSMFERNKIQKIYQIGYEYAQRKIENISHLFENQNESIYRTLNNGGEGLGMVI